MTVTFTVNDEVTGEFIHLGSPRLAQIFSTVGELGAFIRLFEQAEQNTALCPYLMLNVTIAYICDRKKEILHSFGLNLLNGTITENFYEKISDLPLTPKIPDYCFTLTPLIKVPSGIKRIEDKINQLIARDNHQWANQAMARWQHDEKLLEKFYENVTDLPESYHVEKQALQQQYEPKIEIDLVNGGLFYLQ